jgi:uncharacterized repeat protein (TIGR01451 family)
MTVASSTTSTKTFHYDYVVPAASSIDPGPWIAQVTGTEGTEGTITHTEVNNFNTTAPPVAVAYTVDPLTALSGDTLTYTITLTNAGAAPTNVSINQPVAVGTAGLVITSLPSGSNSSTVSQLNLANISVPASGSTVITYTVVVQPGAVAGTLINHTIALNTGVTAIAPSVLIDPFVAMSGNKLLYADNIASAPTLHRKKPVNDSTRSITSQGGNTTLTLSPVLQTDLLLNAGTIQSGIWVSRGASFAGQRNIQATLGYTGASVGTIGSSSVTILLKDDVAGAQYIPFNFTLASPLTLLANTSLTLKITNNTGISGETILVHSFKDGLHPTQVALNANAPIVVDAITVYDLDIDGGGVPITSAGPGDTIWVVATVSDAFGAADISAANLTITNPAAAVTLAAASMTIPTTQPGGAQRNFQISYTLTSALGDWTLAVTAKEGLENTMTATNSILFGSLDPVLTDSYKTVINTTSGNNADTKAGDVLHYTISLVETGGFSAAGVAVADPIPAGTAFVTGSLTIDAVAQVDPANDIDLTGLTVAGNTTVVVEFDVTVNGPPGTLISNTATITNPAGTVTNITAVAEDIVVTSPPTMGTKLLYLENLNGAPYLTRLQPDTAGITDYIELSGGEIPRETVILDLTTPLAKEITLSGTVEITLRVEGAGNPSRNGKNRKIFVNLGFHNGGLVTGLGSQELRVAQTIGTLKDLVFVLSVPTIVIPMASQLQLEITNLDNNSNDDIRIYSYEPGGRSHVDITPTPVINVDSITFWSDTMGAGVPVTNPNPAAVDVDVYARVVISDPFGEADIQAPDETNPSTVIVTDPDGAIVGVSGSIGCTAPCYAYAGEDTTNDVDGATRTFYYIIRVNSDSQSTRGTWTTQVTANEGLELGAESVSHTAAATFTTLLQANLSTSTKTWTHPGDVDPGDTLTYTITLTNTGGIDADNLSFTDTLQTSPVTLTFTSASTTCTDELSTPLGSPTFSSPLVSLNNISVTAGGSCTITINTTVGSGTPGDAINNNATITNPSGASGTPSATTIFLTASAIPVAGPKQLYLDGLTTGGSTDDLTRTPPGVSSATLPEATGFKVLNLVAPTLKAMTLQAGQIDLSIYLSSTRDANYNTAFQVIINTNDGVANLDLNSGDIVLPLTSAMARFTYNFTNPMPRLMPVGSTVQIRIDNDESGGGTRDMIVHQVASAPYSEIMLPVAGAIQVTNIVFYDGPAAGTPNVVTEVAPGATAFIQATIQDAFGSTDVNTGCPDGGLPNNNCPTVTITDATGAVRTPVSPADQMTLVSTNAGNGTRTYEIAFTPTGFGTEGIWTIEVLGSEGNEQLNTDTTLATTLVGVPVLTIVKSVTGATFPGQILVYNNNVNNTGTAAATNITLTTTLGPFLAIELTNIGGNWSAVYTLSSGTTVSAEAFDDGSDSFLYDPTVVCGTVGVAPSPCYDPTIREWRVDVVESMPTAGSLTQQYRVRIE